MTAIAFVGDDALQIDADLPGYLVDREELRFQAELGFGFIMAWILRKAQRRVIQFSSSLKLYPMAASRAFIASPLWPLFSMLIGFVFWYRGLAQGGIAAVGQLQLLQPFFGLILAATLLHEAIGWSLIAVTAAVALCVAGARRFSRTSRVQETTRKGR